jgi:protein phosphatase 1G
MGDIGQALIDAFLGFDATLATPDVINILKEIAGTKLSNCKKGEDDSGNLCFI